MLKARGDHCSATVGGKIYIYGGYNEGELEGRVYSFNQSKGWQTHVTAADSEGPHPSLHSAACASLGRCLYLYGGDDGSNFKDSLYRLDTDSLEWTQLPSGPMRMVGCRMVSFEDQLILFGGFGYPSGTTQWFKENEKYGDGRGWTNELYTFNVQEAFNVQEGEFYTITWLVIKLYHRALALFTKQQVEILEEFFPYGTKISGVNMEKVNNASAL